MIRGTTDGTIHDFLTTFGQCTRALIELLHDNRQLETVEQMFIESHPALLRTAYDGWKRPKRRTLRIGPRNSASFIPLFTQARCPERHFNCISQEGKKSVRLGVLPRQPSQLKTYIKDYRDCPRT